ncbi:hypothetical protein KCU72_g60, partial [Aureobasidium melanogenum]
MAAHYEGVAIADNITGHAHRTPELHLPNQWNLGAEGISRLFDDPRTKAISSALMQKAKKHSLLLESGASSDAGHEDDGTSKHARGSGGGLGGRHVCVLFFLGWSVCGTVMRVDSVCAYRKRVGEELVDEMWMVWLRDGFRRRWCG